MNLKAISQKIRKTRLFSDAQKVELMALLPEASEADIRKLGEGIDAFDRQYSQSMAKHTKNMQELLADLMKDVPEEEKESYQEAIDEIAMGSALLQAE